MAPVKFDDIPKTSTEVLNDDYTVAGFAFKTKQKTNWDGAVVTTAVDLWPAKDTVQTPAKLTWKLPKPAGCTGLSIDKLEVDKTGKIKLEASADKALLKVPDLKVEAKADLTNGVDLDKLTVPFTYTGVKDALIKLELKPTNPADFTVEACYAVAGATLGVKANAAVIASPELGVRYASGPIFASLQVKEGFSAFNLNGFYKVSDVLKVAGNYQVGGSKNGNFSAGLAYALMQGTTLKAKADQSQSVSVSVKRDISKGFTVTAGGKYDISGSKPFSYGVSLSVE